MPDFFRSFNRIIGQKQRATMAYRPQANGTAVIDALGWAGEVVVEVLAGD